MVDTLQEFLTSIWPENTYRLFRYTDEVYKEERCYHQVPIAKKGGGVRILQVPNKKLKWVQRKLACCLQYGEISSYAAAYIKGRTILDHAKQHAESRLLVKLDIENFFGSITFAKVFNAVDKALKRSVIVGSCNNSGTDRSKYFNSEISWFITKVCTLNGVLPQGAPTSPMLSNMVFYPLDQIISSYCMKYNICYTRYSDDMIFSGDFQPARLISFIRKLLYRNGYTLNEDKIVIAGSGRQQKITGVVVNKKPQVDREYRREIRQEIYFIGKYGLEEHLREKGILNHKENYMVQLVKELQKLIGRISFVLQIDSDNKEFQEYKEICVNLLNKIPMIWYVQ